jgi:hypothetical protein
MGPILCWEAKAPVQCALVMQDRRSLIADGIPQRPLKMPRYRHYMMERHRPNMIRDAGCSRYHKSPWPNCQGDKTW